VHKAFQKGALKVGVGNLSAAELLDKEVCRGAEVNYVATVLKSLFNLHIFI
jgi:hypothetical protein